MSTDDPEISDSYMLENLSYSMGNYCEKRASNINTYFALTGWMLCFISHIRKYASDHSDSNHRTHVKI